MMKTDAYFMVPIGWLIIVRMSVLKVLTSSFPFCYRFDKREMKKARRASASGVPDDGEVNHGYAKTCGRLFSLPNVQ